MEKSKRDGLVGIMQRADNCLLGLEGANIEIERDSDVQMAQDTEMLLQNEDSTFLLRSLEYLGTEKLLQDKHARLFMNSEIGHILGFDSFPTEDFFILSIEVLDSARDPEPSFTDVSAGSGTWIYMKWLNALACTLATKMQNDKFGVYACMPNGSLVFLITLKVRIEWNNKTEKQIRSELKAQCMDVIRYAQEMCQTNIRIWGKGPIHSIEELNPTFEEDSWESLGALVRDGDDLMIYWDELGDRLESPKGKLATLIRDLERNVLVAADKHEWSECYKNIAQLIDLDVDIIPTNLRYRERTVDRLVSVFAVAGVPMNRKGYPHLIKESWRRTILSTVSVDETKEQVRTILSDCEDFFSPSVKKVPVSDRVEEIITYVKKNLTNQDLSATMISREFDISLSYLSRLFKESQGIKLIDYIHLCRVKNSKNLLLNHPEQTLEQIAHQVGYNSELTFSRAFRKIEGMTPGAFRRISLA